MDNKDSQTGRQYWKSLDEAADTPEFKNWLHREFPVGASESEGVDRRHFLKIMAASFSLAGLGLAGCRQPKQHILPYSKQPERVVQGVASFFATSMPGAEESMPLIVETHENRPTKVEGNPSYKAYGGGTDSQAQASVLNLYDPDRLEGSYTKDKAPLSPAQVADKLIEIYNKYKATGGEGLAFLADKSSSPTRARLVAELKGNFPNATWAEYEASGSSHEEAALTEVFGAPTRAVYHFDKAKRVLSLESDFLSKGSGNLGHARDFAQGRRVSSPSEADKMNRLYIAESSYSLTGAMADHRLRVACSHMPGFVSLMAAEILKIAGGSSSTISTLESKGRGLQLDKKWIQEAAKDLVKNGKNSVVIAGDHLPKETHVAVALINQALGAVGNTVKYVSTDVEESSTIVELAEKLKAGSVETLFVINGNPVYDAPSDLNWTKLQSKAKEVIRYGYYFDETSKEADVVLAASHYLESWSDGRTRDGSYVPVQPMISPIFKTLSQVELLSYLGGIEMPDSYSEVKETFEILGGGNFDEWLAVGVKEDSEFSSVASNVSESKATQLIQGQSALFQELSLDNLEVRLMPDGQIGDGRYANNGWLQELPDPMTKLTWDNAIIISPRLAKELQEKTGIQMIPDLSVMNKINQASANANPFKVGKEDAPIAEVTVNGTTVRGPVHILPGLANYTLVMNTGYGREDAGRVGTGTGFNAYPLVTSANSSVVVGAKLKLTEERYKLANTQEHWSVEGRAIVRETSAEAFADDPKFVDAMGAEAHSPPIYGKQKDKSLQDKVANQYRGGGAFETPKFGGPQQWGMSIDLNTCTGCNACVVACQSENNIPIVGKDQVLRGREMHWIRLDRYFSDGGENKAELPEDPQVTFMSMLCQHCENAPCETVCPVNATVHDEEGLNVMAYNRCVGTRYCANNCPYKVRRFNFFDWNKRSIGHFYEGPLGPAGVPELEKMQKNPNVTVRMRGVMEKCTFCVQRIEEAKINQRVKAKDSANIKVPDGTIKTACQQVCSTDSIVFGDVMDPNTEVSKLKEDTRDYSALGYLNVRPRVTYLAKLRNPNLAMPDANAVPLSRKEYEDRYGHGSHHGDHHDAHHSAAPHPALTKH